MYRNDKWQVDVNTISEAGLVWRRTVSATAVAILFAVMALASSASVSADGDVVEVFRDRAGPYEVVVGVLPETPRVGPVHFSITLTDAATSLLVDDAEITIVASDELGQPAYQTRALNTPRSPQSYEANISFGEAGAWTVEVRVLTARLGPATFSFPLEVDVLSIAPVTGGALVLLGVIIVLIVGTLYVWYSARRQRRRGRA